MHPTYTPNHKAPANEQHRTLELFQRRFLKSKKELLEAIDRYLVKLNASSNFFLAEDLYLPAVETMLNCFKDMIEGCDLAYADGPFEAYEIVIANTGIALERLDHTEIVFDSQGEIESSCFTVYPPVLQIEARFIPIEEFARRHSTTVETVSEWIARRQIKSAERRDTGWHISETQSIPAEEAPEGEYIFTGETGDLSRIAPLKARAASFVAHRKDEHADIYDMTTYDPDGRRIECKEIDSATLNSLEDAFIRSPNVVFANSLIDIIDEKRVLGLDCNPFLEIPYTKIMLFINQLDLPEATKRELRIMAQSSRGEAIFIEALRLFSLESTFLDFALKEMPHVD